MTHTVPDQGSEQDGQHKLRVAFINFTNWLEKIKKKYVVMYKFNTWQQHSFTHPLYLLHSTEPKMSNYNNYLRPIETEMLLLVPLQENTLLVPVPGHDIWI